MEVTKSNNSKDFEVYETEKFRFKIESVSLDNLRDKEDFPDRITTRVMKGMKIKGEVKKVTGTEWEESVNAIIEEIK